MKRVNKISLLISVILFMFLLISFSAYSQSSNDDFMDPKNPNGFYSPAVNPYMNPMFLHTLMNLPDLINKSEPPAKNENTDGLDTLINDFQNNQQSFNNSRGSNGNSSNSNPILNTNPYNQPDSGNNSHIPLYGYPCNQPNYGVSGQTPSISTPPVNSTPPCGGPCDK